MKIINDFKDYEILDMANGQKLEKWGNIILSRPDPQIIWTDKNIDKWNEYAEYNRSSTGGGKWNIKKNIPDSWIIEYKDLKFNLKLIRLNLFLYSRLHFYFLCQMKVGP